MVEGISEKTQKMLLIGAGFVAISILSAWALTRNSNSNNEAVEEAVKDDRVISNNNSEEETKASDSQYLQG